MHLSKRWRDIGLLNQTSANATRDGRDQAFLSRFLVGVNTKNVLALRLRLIDLLDHSCQVSYVDSWDQVVTLTNYGKVNRVLQPGLLEMGVKDSFTFTVKETSSDNVGLNVLTLEAQDVLFSLADASVLIRSTSHLEVLLSEGDVEHLLL